MVNYRYPESELDRNIHALLDELERHLPCMWFVDNSQINLFGRVYRNPKKGGGFTPEFYRGDGEYKDTFLDDQYAAVAFFGMDDTYSEEREANESGIHCVFFVNLARLKWRDKAGEPQILTGRGDLEARNAVQAVLNQNLFGFVYEDMVIGPAALREYDITRAGTRNSTELNRWDMHPWHVFRVNGTIRWDKPNLNNFDQNN